jgi:hypothetical protein
LQPPQETLPGHVDHALYLVELRVTLFTSSSTYRTMGATLPTMTQPLQPLLLSPSDTPSDEDIPTVDTTIAPTATLPHIPQFQGPLTRARARQLNYQVLSFLGTIPNIHENMMLPKSDVFMLLRNDGPSMDERDKH